ncbi:unnamed protein product [Amoebophrya sp. A25]|nr:unnamed protein product [Amoebophrya sp. A25]|eukprot:GSA25T00011078001.1
MAHLYKEILPAKSVYVDRKSGMSVSEWKKALEVAATLYIGNLSFWTQEEQIWELFSKCGNIVALTMGLNKLKKQPCGFCFLQYRTHEQAVCAQHVLDGARLDGRALTVDLDPGVSDGRQYGRGIESGNQCKDEFRKGFDHQRGGEGLDLLKKVEGAEGSIYTGKTKFTHGKAFEDQNKKRKNENGNGGAASSSAKRQKTK